MNWSMKCAFELLQMERCSQVHILPRYTIYEQSMQHHIGWLSVLSSWRTTATAATAAAAAEKNAISNKIAFCPHYNFIDATEQERSLKTESKLVKESDKRKI